MTIVKRPHVTAIHSVLRFALSVPDLDVAQAYFQTFGLSVERQSDQIRLFTQGQTHCWGVVYQGHGPKKTEYYTVGVYAEDEMALKNQVVAAGYPLTDPHPRSDGQGFWVADPDGVLIQVLVSDKVSPSSKAPREGSVFKSNAIQVPVSPMRSEIRTVHPQRLSHLLIFVTDVPRAVKFYTQALGFRMSDQSLDVIAFLHGAHSSDHHLLAMAKSNGPGLHHSSWVVPSIDDVGLGMEQMYNAGYRKGWGVGRHVIGSNYFYYAQDPWGSFTEFSFDIDFIGSDTDWPSGDYPPEDSMYLWGPAVPEDFIHNYEADATPQ
jgi:catechol-2,3-dioxygenase